MDNNNIDQYIRNFLDGIYTREEARKFLELIIKNPGNENLEKYIQEAWLESSLADRTTSEQHSEYKIEALELLDRLQRSKQLKPRKKSPKRFIYVAASIAAVLVIAFLGINRYIAWDKNNYKQVLVTSTFGERKTITLPDGTTVYLNACSEITYPDKFKGDNRLVELNGQAYFKVNKNERQPFIVKTNEFNVKVLGTEFDVKAYPGDEIFMVNVETGKVQVEMPEAILKLTDKDLIEINTLTENYNKTKDQSSVAVWRTGSLRFNKTPIKDVVKELERLYNYKITLSPDHDFDNLITGEHSNKDLVTVLKSIEITSGINFKIDENNKQVSLYK